MAQADPNTLARLRLGLIPGLGPVTQRHLVRRFGSAAAVFEAGDELAQFAGPAVAAAIARGPDPGALSRALSWLVHEDHRLLTLEDDAYPALLREIHDPPGILYALGDLATLQRTVVAIVGARNATPQGVRDAHAMARTLSGSGICIASGLALGIDAAAHRGGLEGPGSSVAVLGTGPDVFYPRRNRELALLLAAKGCIVSEFPPGTPPSGRNFPRRNRLISGLARAVLVVEANEQSGSLVTAGCALDQDRDVLAMPGSIHSPLSKGCHKLIKQGATLVDCAADVFAALGLPAGEKGVGHRPAPPPSDALLAAMAGAPATADQLALRTGIAASAVAARLSMLQLAGEIEEIAGGRFQRVDRPLGCA